MSEKKFASQADLEEKKISFFFFKQKTAYEITR